MKQCGKHAVKGSIFTSQFIQAVMSHFIHTDRIKLSFRIFTLTKLKPCWSSQFFWSCGNCYWAKSMRLFCISMATSKESGPSEITQLSSVLFKVSRQTETKINESKINCEPNLTNPRCRTTTHYGTFQR